MGKAHSRESRMSSLWKDDVDKKNQLRNVGDDVVVFDLIEDEKMHGSIGSINGIGEGFPRNRRREQCNDDSVAIISDASSDDDEESGIAKRGMMSTTQSMGNDDSLRNLVDQNSQLLYESCIDGHGSTVANLLSTCGEDINVNVRMGGGYTPLMQACAKGHISVVAALLDGCDIPDALVAVDGCAPRTLCLGVQNSMGGTAFMFACRYGHDDIVKLLLRVRADPMKRNDAGYSGIDMAACCKTPPLSTIELLAKHGAYIDTSFAKFKISPGALAAQNRGLEQCRRDTMQCVMASIDAFVRQREMKASDDILESFASIIVAYVVKWGEDGPGWFLHPGDQEGVGMCADPACGNRLPLCEPHLFHRSISPRSQVVREDCYCLVRPGKTKGLLQQADEHSVLNLECFRASPNRRTILKLQLARESKQVTRHSQLLLRVHKLLVQCNID